MNQKLLGWKRWWNVAKECLCKFSDSHRLTPSCLSTSSLTCYPILPIIKPVPPCHSLQIKTPQRVSFPAKKCPTSLTGKALFKQLFHANCSILIQVVISISELDTIVTTKIQLLFFVIRGYPINLPNAVPIHVNCYSGIFHDYPQE